MLWMLGIHIICLLIWCASLLYLPVLILGIRVDSREINQVHRPFDSVERFVFTHLATPVALLAIISGTLVFILDGNVTPWLIVKLSLVSLICLCHVAVGLLVRRAETLDEMREQGEISALRRASSQLRWACVAIMTLLLTVMAATLWTVLAKPAVEVWL